MFSTMDREYLRKESQAVMRDVIDKMRQHQVRGCPGCARRSRMGGMAEHEGSHVTGPGGGEGPGVGLLISHTVGR